MFSQRKIFYNDHYGKICMPVTDNSIQPYVSTNNNLWEAQLVDDIKKYLIPGTVCIDAGSYVGLHSIIMQKAGAGTVVAIEMMPEIYKYLTDNIRLGGYNNIVPINCALGSKAIGHVSVPDVDYEIGQNFGGSSLMAEYMLQNHSPRKISVERRTIDSIAEYLGKVSLIKIDVEGMEMEVLAGAKSTMLRYRPTILIEVWKSGQPAFFSSSIWKFMVDIGYQHVSGSHDDLVLKYCAPGSV